MSERELIDYIQLLLLQGQSVDRIKQGLLAEYPMEAIDRALKKITIKSTEYSPILNQSTAVEPTLSHTLWGNPVNTEAKKSLATIMTSLSLYSIAVMYLFLSAAALSFSFVLDRFSFTDALVLPWLRYFPKFGLLPFIFAIAAIYFFFIATKILDESRRSYWLVLLSVLSLPPLLIFINQLIVPPLLSAILGNMPNTLAAQIAYSVQNIGMHVFDPILLLSLITVILLLFTYTKYKYPAASFSDLGRIMLAILLLFIFLPVASLVLWFYMRAANTDYGYKAIAAKIDFHIYRPDEKMNQLTPTTKYTIEPDGEKAHAVRITFDIPLPKKNSNIISKPITISQERVDSGFDLIALAKTYVNSVDALRQIPVLTSGNKAGYSLSSQIGGKAANYLLFVTADNVLIILSSPTASESDLVQFAESLL